MTHDYWITSAKDDDGLVAGLLLRLKRSSDSSSPAIHPAPFMAARLPTWGQRQPRSKPSATPGKEIEPNRPSPTTPFSWSGASVSDGDDELIRPSDLFSGGRSEAPVVVKIETVNKKKRQGKGKTFSELVEEEGCLLKERRHLKRELAAVRFMLKEQTVTNENLKGIKLDLDIRSGKNTHDEPYEPAATDSFQWRHAEPSKRDQTESSFPEGVVRDSLTQQESNENAEFPTGEFVLPDLNVVPCEEGSFSEFGLGFG